MKYLLKKLEKDFQVSPPGEKIREIFMLNEREHELVKIGEENIQDKINSYYDETNYKDIISKIHSEEDLKVYFPDKGARYGDSTMFADNYLDNIELANQAAAAYDILSSEEYRASEKEKEV